MKKPIKVWIAQTITGLAIIIIFVCFVWACIAISYFFLSCLFVAITIGATFGLIFTICWIMDTLEAWKKEKKVYKSKKGFAKRFEKWRGDRENYMIERDKKREISQEEWNTLKRDTEDNPY